MFICTHQYGMEDQCVVHDTWWLTHDMLVLHLCQATGINWNLTSLHWLTRLLLDKMAAISLTIFSDAFSWMKSFVIRTLHDCPSQMNENLLISNSKLTSDSELIWWRESTNLSSFERDSHVGYRNWPRCGLRWSGWYCNQAQHECCAGLQYQPRQRRPYKWSISILPRSQFYKKQGKLAFSTSCTPVRPHQHLRNYVWRWDS